MQFIIYCERSKLTISSFILPGIGRMRHINGLPDRSANATTFKRSDRKLCWDCVCRCTLLPGIGTFKFNHKESVRIRWQKNIMKFNQNNCSSQPAHHHRRHYNHENWVIGYTRMAIVTTHIFFSFLFLTDATTQHFIHTNAIHIHIPYPLHFRTHW